jgi:hypothetical protein
MGTVGNKEDRRPMTSGKAYLMNSGRSLLYLQLICSNISRSVKIPYADHHSGPTKPSAGRRNQQQR